MNYLAIYSTANDEAFQNRCRVAMWRAAQDISSEPADMPDRTMCKEWAGRVLREEVKITGRQLAMQVLRNAAIAADPVNVADSDIQLQVNSVINCIQAIG